MWNCISLSLIALTISPLQISCYVHLYGKVGDELFGPNRTPCVGETFVLFCDVIRSSDRELVWNVGGTTVTFSRTDSPGSTVDFTINGATRGLFNLTRVSEGLHSTFTLFDVGTAVPNITEVFCHGDSPSTNSPNLWVHTIDQIIAPTFASLISLNDSALQVVLEEPGYGTECVTGYTVEARGILSTGNSSELTLVGLNACDADPENLTAWAHGLSIRGDPVTISTLSSVNCYCQELLQLDDFAASYQILQNETYNLNISIQSQSAVDLLAAVSENSSCKVYSSIGVSPDYIKQFPLPVGRNLTICITTSNCSKIITLPIQISPMELLHSTTLGPSSASVMGQVDLSKFQAQLTHQLQVTGIAILDNTNASYSSPTTGVDHGGFFTLHFHGLPPNSTFTCSVELSSQDVVYGSVPDMILLRTAATSSNVQVITTDETLLCNGTKSSTDKSQSVSGSGSHTLGLPTVTALTAVLGYLAGALSAFTCTVACMKLSRCKHQRLPEEIEEMNGSVEPMYDTVGNKQVGIEWSANEAYGCADTKNIYETAANVPLRSQDNVSLKTNEAYGSTEGIQNPVFDLEANEAYESVEVEGIEVETNQAYEHIDS